MGLSERFELIHAEQKRVTGTTLNGFRGGRPDKRTRDKRARKGTLASAMAGGIAKSGRPHFGSAGGGAHGQGGERKAQFQAELVARVAAASGPGGWQAAWDSAHAGAWRAASAESWGQAGAGSWDQVGWAPTGGSTMAVRAKGKGGGKGRGGGFGGGKGRGGWGQQGLAMQWRRPPSAEEQAVHDALPLALPSPWHSLT